MAAVGRVEAVGDRQGGMFYRGDEFLRIAEVDLATEYEYGSSFHKSLRASVKLENGESHLIEGLVKNLIPLRNRRSEEVTYICEGMTEYYLDDEHVGFGLSEYLNQPGDEI